MAYAKCNQCGKFRRLTRLASGDPCDRLLRCSACGDVQRWWDDDEPTPDGLEEADDPGP